MARTGPKPRTAATAPRVAVSRDGWEAPSHLSDAAKAAWAHIVALLAYKGNLSRTDPMLVECYASNVSLLRQAQAALDKDGPFITRGTGGTAPHPAASMLNVTSMRIKAIINELGLSPASSKHAASTAGTTAPTTKTEGKWDGLLNVTG